MATSKDSDDSRDDDRPDAKPGDSRSSSRPPQSDDVLPDDSFLLEIDDETTAAAPVAETRADASSDELLIVDDEAAAPALPIAASISEPAPVAPDPAIPADAHDEPILDTVVAVPTLETAPVAAAATPPAHASAPVDDETPIVPSQPETKLPSWLVEDETELPSFVAEEEEHEAAAIAPPPAVPVAASQSANVEAAASETAPAVEPLVAAAAAAAAGSSASTSDATLESGDAAQAPLAPVVPLRSSRRRLAWVAAAGILLGVGLAGAVLFQSRRAAHESGEQVAVAPRAPAPTKKDGSAKSDTSAPESESPTSPAEPVAANPAQPEPAVEPTVAPQPEIESRPDSTKPAEPAVAATPAPTPNVAVVPAPKSDVDSSSRGDPTSASSRAKGAPKAALVDAPRKHPLPETTSKSSSTKGDAQHGHDDTIVELVNGSTFRGQILRTRGSHLTLRVGAGEIGFDLAEVTLLDSTAPEYRRAEQMPEASVVLTSGHRLRGRLMKQTPERVFLVVDNGEVVFPRTDVRDVSFTGRVHF
jgi:hypothetical protein